MQGATPIGPPLLSREPFFRTLLAAAFPGEAACGTLSRCNSVLLWVDIEEADE